MLLGTPEQAVWFAMIFSIVPVVPVAALTYRWIERPALDAARRGVPASAVVKRVLGPARVLARAISGGQTLFDRSR